MGIFFKLKKDFGEFKAGEKFDCFNGLVHGVESKGETKYFSNKEYFKLVKK